MAINEKTLMKATRIAGETAFGRNSFKDCSFMRKGSTFTFIWLYNEKKRNKHELNTFKWRTLILSTDEVWLNKDDITFYLIEALKTDIDIAANLRKELCQ